MSDRCPKCGAERLPGDDTCGQCGIVYDKYQEPVAVTPPDPISGPAQSTYPSTSEEPGTSALAIWSLVTGIISVLLICCLPITAIPAIICGHMAKVKIKESGGRLTGDGLALAGLIMGYASIVLFIVWLILFFVFGFFSTYLESIQGGGL